MMRKKMRWIGNPRSDVILQGPRDQYEVNCVWVSLINAKTKFLDSKETNRQTKVRKLLNVDQKHFIANEEKPEVSFQSAILSSRLHKTFES
jgi:hypothetical protein